MKRKRKDCYEDGIVIETDLVAGKCRNPLMMRLFQLLLIMFSLYGTVFSIISGLKIELKTGSIYFFMIVSVLVFFLAYLAGKYGLYILISILGLYLLLGYTLWNHIQNGFWHLENIYIRHLNAYYKTSIGPYKVDDFQPIQVITLFLIFFTVLIAFIICQAILGRLPIFIMLSITLSLIILPLVVGNIPGTLPFAAYAMSLFGLLGLNSGLNFGKKHFVRFKKTVRGKEFLRNRTLQYGIGLKAGFILFLTAGVLLMVLPFIFTPRFYSNQMKIPVVKENIQKKVMEYDATEIANFFNKGYLSNIKLFPASQSVGGLNKGKLGRVAKVRYNNETALKVTVTGDRGTTYLKGFAGSIYDGSSWKEFDKDTLNAYEDMTWWNGNRFQPANLGSQIMELINENNSTNEFLNETFQLDYNLQTISVHNVDADPKSIYIPYYANIPLHDDYDINYEPYVKTEKKVIDYEFDYYKLNKDILDFNWDNAYEKSINYWQKQAMNYPGIDFTKLFEYYQYELAMRSFVYQYYLQVPEQGMDRLREALGGITYEDFKINYKESALSKTVSFVREFIQKDTKYTLSPGVLPEGEDFVDYFLFENKAGYCTHYASSAAIIFRMLGIPARYAEGYVIKDSDFSKGKKTGSNGVFYRIGSETGVTNKDVYELKIKDANAHAWVEIYLDGYGWVPVEVTPGFSLEAEERKPEETKDTEEKEDKPEVKNEPTITPTNEPSKDDKMDEGTGKGSKNEAGDLNNSRDRIYFIAVKLSILLGCVIVILSTPVIISSIIRKNRIKKAALKNTSGKAILYYGLLKRIFEYYDINPESGDYCSLGKQVEEKFKEIDSSDFIQYMELIEKAKFSSNAIAQSELKATQDFYVKVISCLYSYKPWYKTVYYKYIKVF